MPLAPLKLTSNTAAGKTYWRDTTYKKLAFIGLSNDGSGADEHMKSYNFIPGKEYTIRNDGGHSCTIDLYIVDISLINLYFMQLSQLRNDKLNEILR